MAAKLPNAKLDDAIERYTRGDPINEITEVCGISRTSLYREASRRNVTRPAIEIDLAILRAAYESGASPNELARRFGISRFTVTDRLEKAGVQLRDASEANRLRWTRMTESERAQQVQAAHAATKDGPLTERSVLLRALTFEYQRAPSALEVGLTDVLRGLGLTVHPQRAVGPYNIDIAIAPVAVEVFGGGWHGYGRHADRAPERFEYLADCGWAAYVVWSLRAAPLNPTRIAEDIASYVEVCRSEPAGGRRYRVVRGDGELASEGRLNGDYRPVVEPPRHGLNR